MRRHKMLLCSLGMFAMGILCQLYNVFYPNEPYMQQLSFMFVALPSALAIINHYYTAPYQHPPEEKDSNSHDTTATLDGMGRKHILNPANRSNLPHVADTSSERSADDHCSGYGESDQLFGGFK
jgi:hypothetical protein